MECSGYTPLAIKRSGGGETRCLLCPIPGYDPFESPSELLISQNTQHQIDTVDGSFYPSQTGVPALKSAFISVRKLVTQTLPAPEGELCEALFRAGEHYVEMSNCN